MPKNESQNKENWPGQEISWLLNTIFNLDHNGFFCYIRVEFFFIFFIILNYGVYSPMTKIRPGDKSGMLCIIKGLYACVCVLARVVCVCDGVCVFGWGLATVNSSPGHPA